MSWFETGVLIVILCGVGLGAFIVYSTQLERRRDKLIDSSDTPDDSALVLNSKKARWHGQEYNYISMGHDGKFAPLPRGTKARVSKQKEDFLYLEVL